MIFRRITSRFLLTKNRSFYIALTIGLVLTLCWPSPMTFDSFTASDSIQCAAGEDQNGADHQQRSGGPGDGGGGGRDSVAEERQQSDEDGGGAPKHHSGRQLYQGSDFEPQLNLAQKPLAAKKETKNIIRPRYYSSELGIREKLFIGVMSEHGNIESLATAFNKTSAHLADKIKFFINADNVKTTFQLKNIVGFTDTRESLRPFHILKYIADNYLDDYDYFFLVPDTSYLDCRKLREKLSHVSISFDIYLGAASTGSDRACDLDAGIVLSASVIKKVRTNLDWCVRNANGDSHSINIGRCVRYSTKIDGCQGSWQGISTGHYRLEATQGVYRDFYLLAQNQSFNNASVVSPVTSVDDFYRLHLYFSRLHLEETNRKLIALERHSHAVSNGTIRNDILQVRWPIGVSPETVPETRFDLAVWTALNLTHSFNYDSETNVHPLSTVDALDIAKVLNRTLIVAGTRRPELKFLSIHSMYRKFDPVRGMDYKLMLTFSNDRTGHEELLGYDVVKPLGMVEIVPSPYVTESTKIAIILPTFEHQIEETLNFMARYERICMANQDNTFLMLVFLYGAESPSKGAIDVFVQLKDAALQMSDKYKVDGSRIAWVSIRLPETVASGSGGDGAAVMYNSMYGGEPVLSLAVIDLALRKIGLDTLVMVATNAMEFKGDFMNRVRMNTIQGFQIFSPIGFQRYPCAWTGMCRECPTCDVGQHLGYFDRHNVDVIAFYSRDYVEGRKRLEATVPIIRSDKDIPDLFQRQDKSVETVLDVFVRARTSVHILRAVEPSLRLGEQVINYLAKHKQLPVCPKRVAEGGRGGENERNPKCIRVASKKQFGEALIQMEMRQRVV